MTSNTIILKGPWTRIEGTAAAAISPGHLVVLDTTASGLQFHNKYIKHGTLGGNAEPNFAIENDHFGKGIDVDYASGEQVQIASFSPGGEVYAFLKNGENVVIGSPLESAGNGELQLLDADTSAGLVKTDSIVAYALEAMDMSGSSGADPSGRIRVRIR